MLAISFTFDNGIVNVYFYISSLLVREHFIDQLLICYPRIAEPKLHCLVIVNTTILWPFAIGFQQVDLMVTQEYNAFMKLNNA